MNKTIAFATLSGLFVVSHAVFSEDQVKAQPADACTTEQVAISAINDKYKPKYKAVEEEGEQLNKDVPQDGGLKFDFKVDWKDQKWVINLPSSSMQRNEIKTSLPQTSLKTQAWSFDKPTTTTQRVKVGQHPETTCSHDDWGIPYDCTTTWHDNYIDVPKIIMERVDIKMDIPQITWEVTSISWDIPVITWVQNTWVLKIPEFTLVNIQVEKGKEMQARGDALQKNAASIVSQQQAETRAASVSLYSCLRTDLQDKRATTEKSLSDGIASLSATIDNIRAQGADPTKVPGGQGKAIDLVALRDDMGRKLIEAKEQFDKASTDLDTSEKVAVEGLEAK
ncbi:TPA: hypothetical protein ONC18_000286 [Enterobacter kobei]|uniref:hypothetical protein n=1 Tax=Enterobacter asburiae TaxID=61645 RepID=UPI001B8BD30F|nr:hypothetical protein [Enterobacter asburiae]MBS3044234.1 hypothetical protein [Enterobacter asburiae]HCR1907669.1 hypothetical protein [Enterobacter kobei]